MLSSELCGAWQGSPCRTTRLANSTPRDSGSGPVRGVAARRVLQAASRPLAMQSLQAPHETQRPAVDPETLATVSGGRRRRARRIPVGDLAHAPVDASAQRQAKLAAGPDLEVQPTLTASISMIAEARPIAACGCGSAHQGTFSARSRRVD